MKENVKRYYGEILQHSADLKTNACYCSPDKMSPDVKLAMSEIAAEIKDRFYGCGSPIPSDLDGRTVLDLGCGSGRDVYILSKLVGENGLSIGIDMTENQLEVAQKYESEQMAKFGYSKSNVQFKLGYIEDLKAMDIADNSIDIVISNCVINLSPDKKSVFQEIFRVLKPGGELYFSDVFANKRIPAHIANDVVMQGECLGGAMYVEDFRRLMTEVGCADYRVTEQAPITINNPEIEAEVGLIEFMSLTVRAFKLDLEDRCEDFGQVAVYKGTIPNYPHYFELDDHHKFVTGKPMLVCGNTADMISKTRFAKHFTLQGEKSVHYGLFDCTPPSDNNNSASACGC
ncbi:MAG: methyltransferase type 11 [Porphyromonadaceae bacterium CG2_30_38_12]|nr:MAG: methyltransferase type 11 [Porphyromonadaceae bacterium CG2_30_38_12]